MFVNDAARAVTSLTSLWDEMGVLPPERTSFLSALSAEVSSIFSSRVASQADRKAALEAEVLSLQATIRDMRGAMEEPAPTVRALRAHATPSHRRVRILNGPFFSRINNPPHPSSPHPLSAQLSSAGLTLIAFRDALDSARAGLQTAWDARARTLRERESTLFQLYSDIGAGIEANFAATGDRISAARVSAYDAEITRVRAIKSERAAAIKAKAAEIVGLWEELGFTASDDTEQCIARGMLDSLGWAPAVGARLAQKAEVLLAEKAAREERIMIMGQSITALWKRLATPEEEQTAFLEAHAGIGDDVIAAVRAAPDG